jgi:tryptophan synthase alpha chain
LNFAANCITITFTELRAAGRTALIPFITAGDPTAHATPGIMHALVEAGADLIELGVPFSDPMADGPVVQRSSERALAQGVGLRDVLGMVREFRQRNCRTPVVLMGYANPIEAMGVEQFAQGASEAGVDGVLVVDYPPEEAAQFVAAMDRRNVATIFMVAPTTPDERLRAVAELARGYAYYVSLKGVTGAANIDQAEVAARVAHIRKFIKVPLGVGFGIRDANTARAVAQHADAVVIGSALVQVIEKSNADDAAENARAWLAEIRRALDAPATVAA